MSDQIGASGSSAAILTVDINTAPADIKLQQLEGRIAQVGSKQQANPQQFQELRTRILELERQLDLAAKGSVRLNQSLRGVATAQNSLTGVTTTVSKWVPALDAAGNAMTRVHSKTGELVPVMRKAREQIDLTSHSWKVHLRSAEMAGASSIKSARVAAAEQASMLQGMMRMRQTYDSYMTSRGSTVASMLRREATAQKAAAAEQANMLQGMLRMRQSYDSYMTGRGTAINAVIQRESAAQKAAAAEQASMLAGMLQMRKSYDSYMTSRGSAINAVLQREAAVQKVAAAEQASMLAGMMNMRKSYDAYMTSRGTAIASVLQREASVQRASAAEQASMLAGMMRMRQSYDAYMTSRGTAIAATLQRETAAQRASAAEQASMLQGMLKMRQSYDAYMTRRGDVIVAMLRRESAAQKAAAAEQAGMLQGMLAMRKSYDAYLRTQGVASAATASHAVALSRVGHQSWRATEGQMALHSALRGVGGAMGALWLTYGRYVTVMAGAMAITKTFKDSISRGMGADFDAQFVSILQTKGPLDIGLKDYIRDELIDISRQSVFTVGENAEALKKLSLAGVDATSGLKLLTTASNAAIFAQQGLGETTSQVLDTLNNFGLSTKNPLIMADNFKHVADVMAYTAITVNASFTDIATSFQNLTGVAGSFNLTLEESSVLLQSLARTGIRGKRAGTFTRNFLDDLLGAPISQRAEKELKKLGVERFNPDDYGDGEFGAAQYIDSLVAKLRTLDFVEQQSTIRAISNQRSRRVLRQEILESYKQENSMVERTIQLAAKAEGKLADLAEGLTNNARYQMIMAQAAYDAATTQGFAGNEQMFIDIGKDLQELFKSDAFNEFLDAGVKGIAALGNAFTSFASQVVKYKDELAFLFDAAMYTVAAAAIVKVGKALQGIALAALAANILKVRASVVALSAALAANPVVLVLLGIGTGVALNWNAKENYQDQVSQLERVSESIDAAKKRLQQLESEGAEGVETEGLRGALDNLATQRQQIVNEAEGFVDSSYDLNKQILEFSNTLEQSFAVMEDITRKGAMQSGVNPDYAWATVLREQVGAITETIEALETKLASLDPSSAEWAIAAAQIESFRGQVYALDEDLETLTDRVVGWGLRKEFSEMFKALSVTDLSQLDDVRRKLEEEVELLRLGKEGIFQKEQAALSMHITALQASVAMKEYALQDMYLSVEHADVIIQQINRIKQAIASIEGIRSASAQKFKLESKPGRGPRSTAVPEVNDVRKAADAEYQQWMEYVNYSKRIVELRRKSARINESEYQDALDAIAAQSIELGVAREKKVQSEIQDQLAKAKDASIKKQLNSRLEQSFAKEEELKLKATLDRSEINERETERLFKMVGDYSRTLEELGLKQQHVRDEVAQQLALQMQANPIRLAGDMAVLQVARDYRDELEKINRLIAENANNPQELSIHITARENLISDMETQQTLARDVAEYHAETQRSFSHGWEQALIKFNSDSTDYAAKAQDIFTTMSQGIHGAFENFFMNPTKEGFKGLLLSFGQMLQQMIAKAAAAQLTEAIMGKASSSSFLGQAASMLVGAFGGGTQAPAPVRVATITKLAKGGAFDGVQKFAKGGAFGSGKVLTHPTFFKFAHGGAFRDGVAGEAGPEGALPLKRMSNGKLGVYTEGSGGQTVHINVTVAPGTPQEVKRAAGAGAREAIGFLNKAKRYG